MAHPAALFGNQRGGFVFVHPLPPLGRILMGHQFPLSVSPDYVLAYIATSINPGGRQIQSGLLVKHDDIKSLKVEGRKLFVNGRLFIKASSQKAAVSFSMLLGALQKATPDRREKHIRKMLEGSFQTRGIEQLWQEFAEKTDLLNLVTNILFFYLFGLAPIWIWRFGLERSWPALLVGLYGLTATTAILFRGLHKHYYPESEDDRFMHFLTILFSPATTIRARDVLSRSLMSAYHPLAIARVFSDENHFLDLAGRILRDMRFPAMPVCPNNDPAAASTEKFFRTALQEEIERFLRSRKVDMDKLMAAPVPADETCRAWCPRCRAQFTTAAGQCTDCGGVTLVAFGASLDSVRKR
jgi:hypothetical protein